MKVIYKESRKKLIELYRHKLPKDFIYFLLETIPKPENKKEYKRFTECPRCVYSESGESCKYCYEGDKFFAKNKKNKFIPSSQESFEEIEEIKPTSMSDGITTMTTSDSRINALIRNQKIIIKCLKYKSVTPICLLS